jgi:predicted  nucleic acid-binding Zn-ribbon protein
LANLETACKTKAAEWDERCKVRSEELLALADTIKILNDDDALELFKKTLPGASASFMQVQETSQAVRGRAMAFLKGLQKSGRPNRPGIDFIALALHGKKIGFDKVIKMIDDMVVLLKKEQQDDDHKKEDCNKQLDLADDKKKGLERKIADTETAIADLDESIATTASEIEATTAGIKALDKSVAEATAQRKDENEEYTELMAGNSAAKELMLIAKNRMQKFYNPSQYKAPPKRELTEEERLYVASGGTLDPTEAPGGIAGTGVTVLAEVKEHKADPGPAPETFSGKVEKQETSGVMAMMDLMVKDLDKEMTVAETDEKDAQGDYETFMADSKEKRSTDSQLLTEKEAAKAEMEADLEASKESLTSSGKELEATKEVIHSLHVECDFLLKYFDVRKEARDNEIDALGKAKAVLSGADFSLLQARSSHTFLRRL